ncbi:AAA family ATPase [Streptomyces sp. NPDC001046]|uniref:AAA family ATPase n=1 Tax=Streptomyces sp. NPDC001046 TaxID=3364543 RepID=UPI0036A6753A
MDHEARCWLGAPMRFSVLPVGTSPPLGGTERRAYLVTDNWDDWFRYSTQYDLRYRDVDGRLHDIGQVKVGQFAMAEDQRRPDLPLTFRELDNRFFSLGQDDSYYQNLNKLGSDIRDEILRGLRDIALDEELCVRALREPVTGTSLLRSVTQATVEGQFRRLARGGRRLSRYSFTYTLPRTPQSGGEPVSLNFEVKPESEPPTNIHVLIGRNGVGKTHLLNHMARALADHRADPEEVGTFATRGSDQNAFANLVSVTFSAFDPFEPIRQPRDKTKVVLPYAYIGLKRVGAKLDEKPQSPKDPRALAGEFTNSVKVCVQGARLVRWRRALEMLEGDPIFSDARVAELAESAADAKELAERASQLYRSLSSGHKIVLLTVTRLVETVEERSLVLLDEPEAHLHPPLLSAFTRALSDLLINRNGVAIIATHSPVVLQEVPRKCAWRLRRSGREVVVEQPSVETFGENVGVLTREIFGLEVTRAGFHRMLGDAVNEGGSYEDILERFGGQLGGEARGLIRALVAVRDAEGHL